MPAAAASISMSKREEGASCSPGISTSGAGGIKRQKTDVTADAGFATADGELGPESQLQTESDPVKLRQVALDVRQDLHRTNCRNTRMSERSWSGCQAAGCFPTPGRDWGDLDPPGRGSNQNNSPAKQILGAQVSGDGVPQFSELLGHQKNFSDQTKIPGSDDSWPKDFCTDEVCISAGQDFWQGAVWGHNSVRAPPSKTALFSFSEANGPVAASPCKGMGKWQ
jgi:hypothetical protein